MTALQPRTWVEGDRAAVRDRVDEPWQTGTVTGITGDGHLLIRGDDTVTILIRHPADVRVAPVDEVPIDERWWLDQKLRDQLVRLDAADRLDAFSEHLALTGVCRSMARDFRKLADADPALVAAARALLAPAHQPAPTS